VSFGRFEKLRLRSWLRECEEAGRPMPGDKAIATRHDFGSVSLVPRILAEMASEGMITLAEVDGERVITVLPLQERNTQGASGTAREAPSVASSGAAKRITDCAPSNRPAKEVAPVVPSSPQEVPPAPPAVVVEAPPPSAPEAAAHPHEPAPDHPMAVTFERGRKPRIPAAVIRAAGAKGIPLDQFCTDLLVLGFKQWNVVETATSHA
jgi:hypothetical protein